MRKLVLERIKDLAEINGNFNPFQHKWKKVRFRGWLLFDLMNSPNELNKLYDENILELLELIVRVDSSYVTIS